MIDFIAVLDFDHMDNGLFLATLAKSVAARTGRGILLHGDSAYTDRLIQTGMMREDAKIRAMKDLNHRLVALFADEGVATIGLHGYQKEMIQVHHDDYEVQKEAVAALPATPHLILSCLVQPSGEPVQKLHAAPIDKLADQLRTTFEAADLMVFGVHPDGEIIKQELPPEAAPGSEAYKQLRPSIPGPFRDVSFPFHLTTATGLRTWPADGSSCRVG